MHRTKIPSPRRLLVSRLEAAKMLGCHVATVQRLEAAGRLPAVKLAGPLGKTYYRIADIEALVGAGSEPDDLRDRRGLLV